MPAPKAKKYKITWDPELMRVGRAFLPVFGNDDDLRIADRIISLEKMLMSVDNETLRQGDTKKLTTKMKRILQEERYLIDSITSRNNDF